MRTTFIKVSRPELEIDSFLNEHLNDRTRGLFAFSTEDEEQKITSFSLNFTEQYCLMKQVGEGGIGIVSKAKDNIFDRIVAVKTLRSEFAKDEMIISRFIEECKLNAKLDHPSIVPIYGLGKDVDGVWHIAMKYVSGMTLRESINNLLEVYSIKKVSAQDEHIALISRLEYFIKLCDAVSYCHRHNIIHGDIKPENIILGGFGDLYLMDWGCASVIGNVWSEPIGTTKYLPPEFFNYPQATCSLDIYSLGVVLFELVTMQRAGNPRESSGFIKSNEDWLNIEQKKSFKHFLPNLKVSLRLKAIIQKATARNPKDRYACVHDLLIDVRHFIYDEEVSVFQENFFQRLARKAYHNRVLSFTYMLMAILLAISTITWHLYSSTKVVQDQKIAYITNLNLLSKVNSLAQDVDNFHLLEDHKIYSLMKLLIEEYKNKSSNRVVEDQIFYKNEDYLDKNKRPKDFGETSRFLGAVSLDNAVVLSTGLHFSELPSPQKFGEFCKNILDLKKSGYDISYVINNMKMDYVERIYIEWYDGTKYSYPGRFENVDDYYFKKHWMLSNTNLPYKENDNWYIDKTYPLYGESNFCLGKIGLQVRILESYATLCKNSISYLNHGFYIINSNNIVLECFRGELRVIEQKSAFGIDLKTILALRHQMEDHNQQIIKFQYKGKDYYFSAVRLTLLEGGCFCQIVPVEEYR